MFLKIESQAVHALYESMVVMKRILVIGSQGTIGSALVNELALENTVHTISRDQCDYSEQTLAQLAREIKEQGSLQQIYCCIGVLHNDFVSPEKRMASLDAEKLSEYFYINSILPALCLKCFSPLLDKTQNSQFVLLSAMVGSIEDNQLGGWYGYRSSKAALNMLSKTASIELGRTNKHASVAVIHPGTTRGDLSKPFASGISKEKYYSAEESAQRIVAVADDLTPSNSGQFFNWDGSNLPW